VDMDAFFAAVEEVYNPQFQGQPIVVGADPKGGRGRGVVSTANYKAREFGIQSAMPISRAWRACPTAIFLPVNGALYYQVSGRVMGLLRAYTPSIEQVGVDEAYLDMSHVGNFSRAEHIAKKLKAAVQKQEGVTCSVGVAPNKLVAKIASDFKKPNSITVVRPARVQRFLSVLPVRKLPGVGPKAAEALKRVGIGSVGELAVLTRAQAQELFGKRANFLYNAARGVDERPVLQAYGRKSLGEEHTFEKDTADYNELIQTLYGTVGSVTASLTEEGAWFRTATVVVRFADFTTHTKSYSEDFPNDVEYVRTTALKMVWPFLQAKKKIRLIGFRASNLTKHL
jgi:DNA polymerase IV (archaeal DinB-like DNA polymerase)